MIENFYLYCFWVLYFFMERWLSRRLHLYISAQVCMNLNLWLHRQIFMLACHQLAGWSPAPTNGTSHNLKLKDKIMSILFCW